jgi:hypothetical protein
MHHGDVVLATAQAGLVNAHDLHALETLQGECMIDVELDAPPQLLVFAAKQRCGLATWQYASKGQRQGLERRCEARTRPRPGHRQLRGLASACTGHARHVGVQPGLELEEVQMPPLAAQPVVHGLRRTACPTMQRGAAHTTRRLPRRMGVGGVGDFCQRRAIATARAKQLQHAESCFLYKSKATSRGAYNAL